MQKYQVYSEIILEISSFSTSKQLKWLCITFIMQCESKLFIEDAVDYR